MRPAYRRATKAKLSADGRHTTPFRKREIDYNEPFVGEGYYAESEVYELMKANAGNHWLMDGCVCKRQLI